MLISLCQESPLKCEAPHTPGPVAGASEDQTQREWAAEWLPTAPMRSSSLAVSLRPSVLPATTSRPSPHSPFRAGLGRNKTFSLFFISSAETS